MNYLLITLGVLPSLIWLFYFLEKDKKPEPKKMILLIFVFGVLGAAVIATGQEYLRNLIISSNLKTSLIAFLDSFLAISLLEETTKFLSAGLIIIFGVHNLDEPVDFIIYMITAGLGFAALENYLYFSRASSSIIAELVFLRFAITTLFHSLSSGILGYFIAVSAKKMRIRTMFTGLIIVTFFHTLYNTLIELIATESGLFYSTALLAFIFLLTVVLVKAFKETKKMKSICEVK